MSWLFLILSGALEAVWAAALHRAFQASGRRRLAPAALFLAAVAASTGGLAAAMQVEYRLVSRIIHHNDFYEGIRAVIIDRDMKPKWQHESVAAVPKGDIDAMFAAMPGHELNEDNG